MKIMTLTDLGAAPQCVVAAGTAFAGTAFIGHADVNSAALTSA